MIHYFKTELMRLRQAFLYSRDGLVSAFRQDAPFRLEVLLSLVIVPAGIYLGSTSLEKACLVGSWVLVLVTELLNCGLEAITDYATKLERHDLAKKTKDVGSAAVLVALANFLVFWFLILV